jgi:hypothetical protein
MPNKRKRQAIKLRVVGPGEPTPLFVTARAIGKVVIGLSPKTLANWRSYGIGPKYFMKNGSVYYGFEDLRSFFGENPVETFDEEERCDNA